MDNIWYNGSQTDHAGIFDFNLVGSQSGVNDKGFCFTSNKKVAHAYADPMEDGSGFVSQYKITHGNIIEYDACYNCWQVAKWDIGYKNAGIHQMQEIHYFGLNGFEKSAGILFKNINEGDSTEFLGDTLVLFDRPDNSIEIIK
jgi:hypothetical protein